MRYFLVLIFSPFILNSLYDLVFYIPAVASGKYDDLGALFLFYLVTQIFFSIFVSYYMLIKYQESCRQITGIKYKLKKTFGLFHYICIFSILLFLFLFLFYSVFGDFNFSNLILRNAYFYAKSKIGTAWVFFLYQFFIVIMMYDMYKEGFVKYKVIILFACIFIIALTGGRSSIMFWGFILIFIYSVCHRNELPGKYVLITVFSAILVFSSNAILRSNSQDNVSNYLSSASFIMDFDSAYVLQDAIDYTDKNNDYFGVALVDLVYAFVPRSLYKDKPVSTAETRLLYPERTKSSTTNITFGYYGNLVLNLGVFGLILSPIILFYFSNIYFNAVFNSYKRDWKSFLLIYFFVMYVYVLRGGIINVRIILSLLVVSFSVCAYEALRRLTFKKRKVV